MSINKINAATLQKMFLAGAKRIEARKEYINELNVFPVPDGDTGTNMSLTIMSAAKEVSGLENPAMAELTKAISTGSLRGARGNSGVILSQLFRGFCRETAQYEELGPQEIAAGFKKAVETAYKAVMKPKEGTILTVAKGMATKAADTWKKAEDLESYFQGILDYGYETLDRTPDMLPVLKEAGVVDSGGQGLMEVMHGAFNSFLGKEDEDIEIVPVVKPNISVNVVPDTQDADIKFGYCTEFIIMLEKEFTEQEEENFKSFLLGIGDSLVVVADDEIVKVHVHTNHPGQAFEKALEYGSLSNMKVDNMRLEHQEKVIKEAEKMAAAQAEEAMKQPKEPAKEVGFIAVSIGEGMNEILRGLGVDYIIEGGQTMNPSTDDIMTAIEHVNAKAIFVLPNNKNIILAAEQAKDLTEDKEIIVIPTKTVPQGITAIVAYDPSASLEENEEMMAEEILNVKTGQVTYAVRDTSIDGKEIKVDDIMGIGDKGILAVGSQVQETTMELLDVLVDEDAELICLYRGQDVSKEAADALLELVEQKYPDCDVELHDGGQPIYYYVLSVE
ncbi:MAG: DAK2 domain-containing protein [Lachnospiraceae bacterium]